MFRAKYQNLNVPYIPLHVRGRKICWPFLFLSITMSHWFLSSFGAKRLKFMKKQDLCIIPGKYSAHHWDFLMITVRVFWLIRPRQLTDDIIRIWSESLISSFQVSVPHFSHNITQLHHNFQFWLSSSSSHVWQTHSNNCPVSRCFFLTISPSRPNNCQVWYSSHKFIYILITHIRTVLQTQ